jgi:hypothetical protein
MGEYTMIKDTRESTKAITRMVRFNYVNVFKPRDGAPGEDAKYNLQIMIRKTDVETLGKLNGAIEAAKIAGASLWGGVIPGNIKMPLMDGDVEKQGKKEYEGHYFITCASKFKPRVLNKERKEILDETQVYSGCYGRVSLSFYPYDKECNKGIGCGLLNVQKLAEGEPLGRSRAEEDFADDYEEDDILW